MSVPTPLIYNAVIINPESYPSQISDNCGKVIPGGLTFGDKFPCDHTQADMIIRSHASQSNHLATEAGGIRVPVILRLLTEHVVIRSHGAVGFVPQMDDKL